MGGSDRLLPTLSNCCCLTSYFFTRKSIVKMFAFSWLTGVRPNHPNHHWIHPSSYWAAGWTYQQSRVHSTNRYWTAHDLKEKDCQHQRKTVCHHPTAAPWEDEPRIAEGKQPSKDKECVQLVNNIAIEVRKPQPKQKGVLWRVQP